MIMDGIKKDHVLFIHLIQHIIRIDISDAKILVVHKLFSIINSGWKYYNYTGKYFTTS
jgi:hypothetical protein